MPRGPTQLSREAQAAAYRRFIQALQGNLGLLSENAGQYGRDVLSGDVMRRGIVWGDTPLGGGVEGYTRAILSPWSGDREAFQEGLADAIPGAGFGGKLMGGLLGTFAGKNAKTANRGLLAVAEEAELAGLPRKRIFDATGWYRGKDGQWRWEIDDSGMNFTPDNLGAGMSETTGQTWKQGTLPEAVEHPALFNAYPEMRETAFEQYPFRGDAAGTFRDAFKNKTMGWEDPATITLWDTVLQGPKSVTAHESMHNVQSLENFARGGTGKSVPVQARPVSKTWQKWAENKELAERGRKLLDSQEYKKEIYDMNKRWSEVYEPRMDAIEEEWKQTWEKYPRGTPKAKQARDAWSEKSDALFREVNEDTRKRFPVVAEVEEIGKVTKLDEPPKYISDNEAYKRIAGEVEARNVQARLPLSADDRRMLPPWLTEDVPEADQIVRYGGGPAAAITWHGGPHKWDVPDIAKVGTGEGAQAQGHGFYSADRLEVGKSYQDSLSKGVVPMMRPADQMNVTNWWGEAAERFPDDPSKQAAWHFLNQMDDKESALKFFDSMPDRMFTKDKAYKYYDEVRSFTRNQLEAAADEFYSPGYLYKLDIPDEDIARYLDWDKPLSEQIPEVRRAIESDPILGEVARDNPSITPYALVHGAEPIHGAKAVSDSLLQSGVPGTKYLDGSSRGAGAGTYNYVTFDPRRATVLERNGEIINTSPARAKGMLARHAQEGPGGITLYRATTKDEKGLKKWTAWSPEKETAEAYTDNPGYGGGFVRSEKIPIDEQEILDVGDFGGIELARLIDPENADELAQTWIDNGWRYPWEESQTVADFLESSPYKAIRYEDDFPSGATTVVLVKDAPADDLTKSKKAATDKLADELLPKKKDLADILAGIGGIGLLGGGLGAGMLGYQGE